jgi:hypothetical protein
MNPLDILEALFGQSGGGPVKVVLLRHPQMQEQSEAEYLQDEAHALQCDEPRCKRIADHLRQCHPERVLLIEKWKRLSPATQFKAMMENWTEEKIEKELQGHG